MPNTPAEFSDIHVRDTLQLPGALAGMTQATYVNWKKIAKFLPNAVMARDEGSSVQVIVNRERVEIQKGDESLVVEHEMPEIEVNR